MNRNDYLIRKKIYKYMLPSIMMTVALQLGNVVDAIIVGNLLGSYGNSAISLAVPYVYILQLAAILFGMGGSVTAAIYMGKRDNGSASAALGYSVAISIAFTLIFALLSPLVVPPFSAKLSGGGELGNMVRTIMFVYSYGMPFVSFVLVIAYFMNVDNNPNLAAALHITANVVNLVLDYILVKYTPLGIAGSTLSTIIGYLVGGGIFIPIYLAKKNRILKIKLNVLKEKLFVLYETVKNGLPSVLLMLLLAVGSAILNTCIVDMLGQDMMAVYAVAYNTKLIVDMCLNGVVGVIATIAGVLYGEKDYFGIRKLVNRITVISIGAALVLVCFFMVFPQAVAALYGFNIDSLMPLLEQCLRIFSVSFVFYAINAITQNYYRTIGRTTLSTIDTVLQSFVLKILFALVGIKLFGVKGIFYAFILSEIVTFIIVNIIRIILQKINKVPQKGFMTIPEKNENSFCDVTIEAGEGKAVSLAHTLVEYCREHGVDKAKSNAVGIAAEEIAVNISRYGYKKAGVNYIDVCLTKAENTLVLRIRDDGVPFDPLEYSSGEEDEFELGGLELIKATASKLDYTRVLNMNNTIVEINL